MFFFLPLLMKSGLLQRTTVRRVRDSRGKPNTPCVRICEDSERWTMVGSSNHSIFSPSSHELLVTTTTNLPMWINTSKPLKWLTQLMQLRTLLATSGRFGVWRRGIATSRLWCPLEAGDFLRIGQKHVLPRLVVKSLSRLACTACIILAGMVRLGTSCWKRRSLTIL
jgi:hypothetical protein